MKCPHYNKHIKLFYKSKKQNKHPTNNIFLVTHENQRSLCENEFYLHLNTIHQIPEIKKKNFQ